MPSSEYQKKWYQKNKEKLLEKQKQYYENNKEKILEYQKEWVENNKEKTKVYKKNCYDKKTYQSQKCYKLNKWKGRGVILKEDEDWDSVYEYYLICENCEECGVKLTIDRYRTSTTKCLDHSHETGFIRNIVCHSCNMKRRG